MRIPRGGTVVTTANSFRCDVGIRGEKVVALAEDLSATTREIAARGKLVLPGGIDSHCHVADGALCADPGSGAFLRCERPKGARVTE